VKITFLIVLSFGKQGVRNKKYEKNHITSENKGVSNQKRVKILKITPKDIYLPVKKSFLTKI